MQKPEMYEVNGYDVIKGSDFKWRIWNDDGPLGEPFDLLTEAVEAAEKLPPKGSRR
ncbi:hypothetical protein [Pseudomonas sp. UBA7530]|uniref:hypothetical protein n=1 Tax=Pseudomonas sp. UBA7530 TaxID=1947341 RepID=UPI0025FF2F6F|nr:hypothetical protein [Pseudomonas sp. UBA7530]